MVYNYSAKHNSGEATGTVDAPSEAAAVQQVKALYEGVKGLKVVVTPAE